MRLKQIRKELKYTKSKVAELLGVQKATYDKWENNIEPIPTKRLYELANIYHINMDYLSELSNLKLNMTSSTQIKSKNSRGTY